MILHYFFKWFKHNELETITAVVLFSFTAGYHFKDVVKHEAPISGSHTDFAENNIYTIIITL
jgi:hypothetical protein